MTRAILIASLAASFAFAQEDKNPYPRMDNAINALREIMNAPDKGIPEELIEKAQCVVVVPDLVKGAFIFGGKYGRGFAACRNNGRWSRPGGVMIAGGSFGLQLGGSATDLVMLVMNKRGMEKLMGDKFTIGGEIAGAAGPVGRHLSAQTDATLRAEILTWSRSRGLFGGISLDGATLKPDKNENRKLYGREVSQRDILSGRVPGNQDTREFDALLARISRPGPVNVTENPRRERPAERLSQPGGRMTLGEKQVHFATGQSAIPEDASGVLNDIAQTMKDHPAWKIRIEGYTDNTGTRSVNMKLSQQRADAVMNWLADHGVDRSRMAAKGYGEARPVGDNSNDDGRAQNRRVEIVRTDQQRPTGE
jgi:lipid-binding SYLF domain-containing protein